MRVSRYELDDHKQANGYTYVTEIHTIDGREFKSLYLAPPKTDYAFQLEKKGLMLEAQVIREQEDAASIEQFNTKLNSVLSAEVEKSTFSSDELSKFGYPQK